MVRAEEVLKRLQRLGIDPTKVFVLDPRAIPSPIIQRKIDAVKAGRPEEGGFDEQELAQLQKLGPQRYLHLLEQRQKLFMSSHKH